MHAYLGCIAAITFLGEAQEIRTPCNSFVIGQLIPQSVARHNYKRVARLCNN